MGFEDLSPELQEKARACKSKEELAGLAKAVGEQLFDDEREAVAGGTFGKDCQRHGSIRRVDTQFLKNTGYSKKPNCPTLSECKEPAPSWKALA